MTIKGEHGWLVIIGTVVVVDLVAAIRNNDETLSSAQYRARRRHPVIVTAAVVATAYHLLCGDDDRGRRLDLFQLGIVSVRHIRRIASQAAPASATHPIIHPQPQHWGYDVKRGQSDATLS